MQNIEKIKEKIDTLPYDLRVETILACLFEEEDLTSDKLLISKESQFKRSYSKDVLKSEIVDFDYDTNQLLRVSISRDGIYDVLPEAYFHYPKYNKPKKSIEEMTGEYRKQKQEEEEARKFFLPFENELFYHALKTERLEKDFFLELNGSKPFDFFYDFWGIDRSLPSLLIAKFIRLLPYAYKIVSNLPLTVDCLQYLLKEKVEVLEIGYKEQSESEQTSTLGDSRLGLDLIAGSNYVDYSLYLEFKIGPLKSSLFSEYIHEGDYKRFLDIFFEYFLPMEIDYKVTLLLPEEVETFDFSKSEPVLGVTTRI